MTGYQFRAISVGAWTISAITLTGVLVLGWPDWLVLAMPFFILGALGLYDISRKVVRAYTRRLARRH